MLFVKQHGPFLLATKALSKEALTEGLGVQPKVESKRTSDGRARSTEGQYEVPRYPKSI